MEAIKGTIQGKRTVEIEGRKLYKHVLCAIILTDDPNCFVDSNIEVVMGESSIMEALTKVKRYVAPQGFAGGDITSQLLGLGDLYPDDLEEIVT